MIAGCAAVGGGGSIATIDADLTVVAFENESIGAAATAEQDMVVATVAAAGTRIARLAAVNAALGATLRAHHTGTPEVRAVVVSADDMGDSLEGGMMEGEAEGEPPVEAMRVANLSTAAGLDRDSGCSTGAVARFSAGAERIYVTAEVSALPIGTLFEVDWRNVSRSLYRGSWLSDFSRSFVCIWFYATPVDFPFTPGNYAATLFADGAALGTTEFAIAGG